MSNILNVPIGDEAPEIFNAVVEIPRGSSNKYEFDEELGVFKLDRTLYSPVHYPLDYGFIPHTRSEDGDHLDVMILGGDPLFTGCVVRARPIGLLRMTDNGEEDCKILAVQADNPRLSGIRDIKDIESFNPHLLKEISHFFDIYKHLQGKKVAVLDWTNAEDAMGEIRKSMEKK